tara:strand:- start:57922 stop:60231 length:2310 start_codon:yes stop_codon:yes gene_type:complete
MSRILLIMFAIFYCNLFSQDFIIQNIKGENISGVQVFSEKKSVISDNNGIVNLSNFNNKTTIKIQHISYLEKEIIIRDLKENIIILYPKNFIIEEIEINSNSEKKTDELKIISLNKKKIEESLSKNTAETLEKTSAISVQKSQNGGGSPNIRGFEANRILLIVDGVKLNNTMYRSGHLQNILSIDQNILNDIKVIYGPSSVFYGSGSVGGAIVMNTLNPKTINKNYGLLKGQYESSSNSYLTHFHNIYNYKKGSYLQSISYKQYGNLNMGNNRLHGYENWGKDEFTTENNTQLYCDYKQIDLLQKTSYKINDHLEINLNNQYSTTSNINRYDKLNDIVDGGQKFRYWYYGPQKRLLSLININQNIKKTIADNISNTFSLQKINESRHTQKMTENHLNIRSENLIILNHITKISKYLYNHSIKYGIDNRFQNLNSKGISIDDNNTINSISPRYPDGGSHVFTNSIFLLSEYNIHGKSTFFNGIRIDNEKITLNFTDMNQINIDDEINLNNTNFSISSNFSRYFNEKNHGSFSIYKGFRSPNVDDVGKIFSKTDGLVVVPNPELKAEKIYSSELTYAYINEKIKINVNLFFNFLRNAIAKRDISYNDNDSIMYEGEMMKMIANTNINSARLYGFNFKTQNQINDKITINTLINFVNGTSSDSLPLSHIPPFSIKGELNYIINNNSRLCFFSKFNAYKPSENFDANGVDNLEEATIDGIPSWCTFNINYTINVSNLKINLACENITDIHYKTFGSGISSSGRNFIVSLHSKF